MLCLVNFIVASPLHPPLLEPLILVSLCCPGRIKSRLVGIFVEKHQKTSSQFKQFNLKRAQRELCRWKGCEQCDQIGRFIGLWTTFKAFGNN